MSRRPNITLAVRRLVRDLARRVPALAHVRASRILVVAGEARRASRATIRGAAPAPGRPAIALRGRRVRYVVTLRPRWFIDSTPRERVATVLHEIYHASTRFDGTLHVGRRHRELEPSAYGRRIRPLLEAYLARAPESLLAPFAHEGEVRVRMWLERPGARAARGGRQLYTERQLFQGVMPMRSPPERRRARPLRGLDEEEGS
ncbi:MAG TPA: putative metallopeptidase [Anaeromyxobacteraceae bacterium]